MKLSFYVYKSWSKRLAAYLFDSLGRLLFSAARDILKRSCGFDRIDRILVIRLDHLGDVVMTWPAVRALERMFPEASIDLLVSSQTAPLLRAAFQRGEVLAAKNLWFSKPAKWIDQVKEAVSLAALLRQKGYELAIDFRGDLRNIILMFSARIPLRLGFGITGGGFLLTHQGSYDRNKHRAELSAELLKFCERAFELKRESFQYPEDRKKIFWPETDQKAARSFRRIAIHPGASSSAKQWPLANFRRLIENLAGQDLGQLVLIGTGGDKEAFAVASDGDRILDMRGKTALSDLPILIDECEIFIGNDSGPAHIAAAQGKHVISIFSGTNRSETWHPWTSRLRVIEHPVPCSPCEARVCPLRHHECMEKISVEEVLNAVQSVFYELSNRP